MRLLLPRLVAERGLLDAEDVTAVLSHWMAKAAAKPNGNRTPDFIAGLIPAARGPVPDDVRAALDERRDLIEARAQSLAATAVRQCAAWVLGIGEQPLERSDRQLWLRHLTVVAAYRDRYGITTRTLLGSEAQSAPQRRDAQRATAALRCLRAISGEEMPGRTGPSSAGLILG